MPNNAVEYLKNNIDFIELLKLYGVDEFHGTEKIRCKCPLHGSNNPTSFIYDTQRKLWYCHSGCFRGGDLFDFIMIKENMSFAQSVNYIAKLFTIDISNMSIDMRTVNYIQETRKWIRQMVKHTSIDEIKPYDISVLGKLYNLNNYRNFTKETLSYFNVKYCTNATIYDIINNREIQIQERIIVPIYHNNALIGVTMRSTRQNEPKWLHQPSGIYMGNYVYNEQNIVLDKPLMITEGCGDVWNAYQNGYSNVIAMFGAHMTEMQETILLSKTYNILLALDPDYAGIKAMQNIYERLRFKMNIEFLNVPIGNDVGDLNKEKTKSLLNNILTYKDWSQFEYVDDIINKNISMKDWDCKWKKTVQ